MAVLTYEIYLLNVPFNSDYKNILYFGNDTTRQFNTFSSRALYHYSNLNIVVKNGVFILKGTTDNFDKCNYLMYKSQNDERWYYAFIDEVLYNSYQTTKIYHTLDVWQTYHTTAKFNSCFIERGHIKKSEDEIGRWIAPEPIGFGADFETEHNIFEHINWQPFLVIESLSLPFLRTLDVISTYGILNPTEIVNPVNMTRYEYGGVQSSVSDLGVTGYYRIHPSPSYLKNLLSLWQNMEYTSYIDKIQDHGRINSDYLDKQSVNHIGDILSFSYLPLFILGTGTPITRSILGIDDNGNSITVGDYIYNAISQDESDYVDINNNRLGCFNDDGEYYKPINNKLYTSLARCFKIYNRNGLSIPLRPELLNDINRISLTLHMHTYGNDIKIEINYNDLKNNYINIPYHYSFQYGINNNVGVAQETAIQAYATRATSERLGYIAKGIGIVTETGLGVGSIASGFSKIPRKFIQGFDSYEMTNSKMVGIGSAGVAKGVADTFNLVGDIMSTEFDLSVQRANAYASQTVNIGNMTGDRNNINPEFTKLRLAECNPTYNECKIIDDFLTRYGYSIQSIEDLQPFLHNRNHWNFIKTKGCRCNTQSPNKDNVAFNMIFDNGTTVWEDIDEIGDYTLTNE